MATMALEETGARTCSPSPFLLGLLTSQPHSHWTNFKDGKKNFFRVMKSKRWYHRMQKVLTCPTLAIIPSSGCRAEGPGRAYGPWVLLAWRREIDWMSFILDG